MQPELKSNNIVSIGFSFTVEIGRMLRSKIKRLSKPGDDGDSPFFDSYPGHRCMAVVYGMKEKTNRHKVVFNFAARSGGKLPKYFPRVNQLLDILTINKEEITVTCDASFVFKKNTGVKTFIDLPMDCPKAEGISFCKIQGVHLIEKDKNKKQIELYLDSPKSGGYIANIYFTLVSNIDEYMADKVLAEANSIIGKFIIREQSNVSKN
jgi:hypothetical protein